MCIRDRLYGIGGLRIRWADRLASTHLWDGVNLHHIVNWTFESGTQIGALLVEQDGDYFAGGTLSFGFGAPWSETRAPGP